MFQIIGIVVLFGCVFGSFIMSGGNIAVVLGALPFEMLTIGGAATAALLTANSLPVIKSLGGGMGKVFKGAKWKATDYRDLLSLLFLLTKTMKSKGVIALESHIETPQESSIFSRYPKILHDHSVHVSIGFALVNQGPGIARELYVNARLFPPNGKSRAKYDVVDPTNWTGQVALGVMLNLISNESYRLAPNAMVQPFSMELYFLPPFESDFSFEITFGHQNWPMRKLATTVQRGKIATAYGLFVAGRGEPTDETKKLFMVEVFPFKQADRSMSLQEYDIWLAPES